MNRRPKRRSVNLVAGINEIEDQDSELPPNPFLRTSDTNRLGESSTQRLATASSATSILASLTASHQEDEEYCSLSSKLQQQYMEFEAKSNENSDLNASNVHALDALCVKESRIQNNPRGEPIVSSNHRFSLFNADELNLKNYQSELTNLDRLLKNCTTENLLKLVRRGVLQLHFLEATNKDEIIRYVFALLNVFTDPLTVQSCSRFFMDVFQNNPENANYIDLQELLKSVINLGADLDRVFPEIDLRNYVNSVLDVTSMNMSIDKLTIETTVNIEVVQNLVTILMIVLQKSKTWKDKDLIVLLVILFALALDVKFINSPSIVDLKICISFIIQQFNVNQWPQTVSTLSRYICSLTKVHCNFVFLVDMLIDRSERSDSLKKVTAFCAIHKILGKNLPICQNQLTNVSPQEVINLLNRCTALKSDDDLYMWFSVLNLINSSVSNIQPISMTSSEELCGALNRLVSSLKDDHSCMDDKKVKDLATRIITKWSIIRSSKTSQKTLSRYFPKASDETEN